MTASVHIVFVTQFVFVLWLYLCLYSYLSWARTNIPLTRDDCCAKSSVILVDGGGGSDSGGAPHIGGGPAQEGPLQQFFEFM